MCRDIPLSSPFQCLTHKNELNMPEKIKLIGCNYSLVHTNFMIGSDEINVTGISQDGKEVVIIKDGEFKI